MVTLVVQPEQREVLARRTAILGVLYQVAYAGSQLVALGMIARQVDRDLYGLWITVFAITTWVPLLGLGQNAVMLTVVGAAAQTDRDAAARAFSAALALVAPLVAALLFALLATAPWSPWPTLLNARTSAAATAATAVAVSALGVSLAAVPLVLGSFVVFAHQRGDLVHLAMIAGSLCAVGAMLLAAEFDQALWVLGSAAVSGPLLGGLLICLCGLRGNWLPSPRWRQVGRAQVAQTLRAGGHFLVIDMLFFVITRTPEFIVAQIHGAQAVAGFGSVGRLPVMFLAICQAILLPFWPPLAAAAANDDRAWIRSIAMRGAATLVALWLLAALLLPTAGPGLIAIWLGRPDLGSLSLLLAACAQCLGLALLAWLQLLLSALSRERNLIAVLGCAALAYSIAAVWAGRALGPVGVALAQAAALIAVALPLALPSIRDLLAKRPRPPQRPTSARGDDPSNRDPP